MPLGLGDVTPFLPSSLRQMKRNHMEKANIPCERVTANPSITQQTLNTTKFSERLRENLNPLAGRLLLDRPHQSTTPG